MKALSLVSPAMTCASPRRLIDVVTSLCASLLSAVCLELGAVALSITSSRRKRIRVVVEYIFDRCLKNYGCVSPVPRSLYRGASVQQDARGIQRTRNFQVTYGEETPHP